jgi:hypothetical protein
MWSTESLLIVSIRNQKSARKIVQHPVSIGHLSIPILLNQHRVKQNMINMVNIDGKIFGDTMYSVLRHGCVYDPKTSLNDFTRALLGEGRPFPSLERTILLKKWSGLAHPPRVTTHAEPMTRINTKTNK